MEAEGERLLKKRASVSHLDGFFELDAKVLEDAEALVQLEGVLVFAEEVDERAALPAHVHPAPL